MSIPTDSEKPRLNVSVNEIRRQEARNSRQENTFRFAEPPQLPRKEQGEQGPQIFDGFDEREERKEKQPRQPMEISFSIRPWKALKFLMVLVLLSGVFFAGRWSMDGTDVFGFSSPAPTAAAVSEKAVKNEASIAKEAVKEAATDAAKEAVAALPEEKSAPKAEAPAAEVKAEAPASSEPENIITKYFKVALAVPTVKKEWYGSWGKIMQFSITIKNNEAGTIKPAYFIMNVEGYDDFDKKVSLPTAAQTIKAGEKLDATVNVPNGFAYSPATKGVGDLAAVHIIFNLYDSKDVLITAYETDYNLKG